MTLDQSLYVLNLLGIFVFSLTGAFLAIRRKLDLYGVIVLGCVTAVGGGSIRDALTGTAPPIYLRDETFLWVAIGGAIIAFLFPRLERYERTLSAFDTAGLALFAVSGALGGIQMGFGVLGVIFVGTLSGVGGGIIRDVLVGAVPSVLYRNNEIYATAAAAGALTVYLLHGVLPVLAGQLIGIFVVVALRWLSRRGFLKLPVRTTGVS